MVTSVTASRTAYFTDWHVGRLVSNEMKTLHENQVVNSLAWVVMPDHFHWLFELCSGELGNCLQYVKMRSATAINHRLNRDGRIWQPGYFERAMRRHSDIKQAARYIIANPLRQGLVQQIGDYPLWDAIWLC